MPELPEVETTKNSLSPLINKKVTDVAIYQPKLRWAIPEDLFKLIGYELQEVVRRAKYLILTFKKTSNNIKSNLTTASTKTDTVKKVIIHLGMSGSLQQHPSGSEKRKHDHLIFTFSDPMNPKLKTQLHYHDPRRFGAVLWYDDYQDKLFSHLGVEPLDDLFDADYLYDRIWHLPQNNQQIKPVKNAKTKQPIRRPIKAVIMDQAFVVGVGNIYATESLFLSGIHPLTPANTLTKEVLGSLVKHIKTILEMSIKQGGSTLKDFTVADGKTGYFQQTLNVYGKHGTLCPTCNTPIEKVIITGRASTFCPKCQPLI